MKKRIYIPMAQKGGIAKTFTAILLADWFYKNEIPFTGYDADRDNQKKNSFSKAYQDARKVFLRDKGALDGIFRNAAENTIIDLPAGNTADFIEWFSTAAHPRVLAHYGIEITAIGVLTPEEGVFAGVIEWAQKMKNSCNYWLVLNERIPNSAEKEKEDLFPDLYQKVAGKKFLEAANPQIIQLPYLLSDTASELGKMGMLPTQAIESGKMDLIHQIRLEEWLEPIHAQFDAIFSVEEVQ